MSTLISFLSSIISVLALTILVAELSFLICFKTSYISKDEMKENLLAMAFIVVVLGLM